MFHNCMKLSLAVGALCLTGLIGSANAVSPMPELRMAPIAIPVVDEGTAIEEEERPNEVTPGSESKDAPAREEAQPKSDSGDIGLEEIQREYPTEKLPPDMDK
jgi:hypothetical protein